MAEVAAATRFTPELIGAIASGAARPEETARVLNVTVNAGMGTDGQSVAKEIVDTLRDYERLNGYIPITSQYVVAV